MSKKKTEAYLKPDSAKKNILLQATYQFVILGLPLIIAPYLTRVLGSNQLGIYSYTYSIAYYFVIFAMLGIKKHGQRIIAQRKNDLSLLRKTFWSLLYVHLASSVVVLIAYYVYVVFVCANDKHIALIQGFYVASAVVDITWFFYGIEKFKSVVLRNTLVKLCECICIFAFVKSPADLWKYTLIMSLSIFIGQAIMVPQVVHRIPRIKVSWSDIQEHFRPLITLFIATIAISLYTMFDRTLLGILSSKANVAYYEYSNKLIKIPETLIGVVGTVLFPRVCNLLAHQDIKSAQKYMKYSITFTMMIGFGAIFGLAAISKEFIILYYGSDFAICSSVMTMMTPLILIVGLGDVFRSQYLYPMKMDQKILKIIMINAAVNLVVSGLLIPKYGVYGAVIGTSLAELTGFILEMIASREVVDIKYIGKEFVIFACIGFAMYVILGGIQQLGTMDTVMSMVIRIVVGAVFYMVCSFCYIAFFNEDVRNQVINLPVIRKVFKRRSKHNEI